MYHVSGTPLRAKLDNREQHPLFACLCARVLERVDKFVGTDRSRGEAEKRDARS